MTPTATSMDTLYVLVHGAWHGAVHWGPAQRALAVLGAPSVAVDLPGHGFTAPLPSGYLAAGQPGMATEKSQAAAVTMDDCADEALGRVREVRWGPRTLDVDIIAVGEESSDDPVLTLPHPRAHERAFVLRPWADVDPGARIAGRGTVADLLAAIEGQELHRRDDLELRV